MATLIIERKKSLADRFRFFSIYLNEKKINTIGNGEKIKVVVEEGKHQLMAKIDWYTSLPITFDIKVNQTVYFSVYTPNLFYAIYYAFSNKHKYLTLELQKVEEVVRL